MSKTTSLETRIANILARAPVSLTPVSSSWGMQILKAEFETHPPVLVKHGRSQISGHLAIEAFMLNKLAETTPLPVPKVYHCEPDLLIMAWIESTGSLSTAHQHHAGELLAASHSIKRQTFGLDRDTTIGALPQPNPRCETWIEFFAQHRLLYMGRQAMQLGKLSAKTFSRLEKLAAKLSDYISEPPHPALLHGDLWGGNILPGANGKIAAVIDPAIYNGHPEIELAFTQMFATFQTPFFESYAANAPFEKDFFEIRCDLYNLYPTLVHIALFGSSYLPPLNRTLSKLGC